MKKTSNAPNCYITDHVHSRVICNAFASGCHGKLVPPLNLLDGPAVVYGILRGCGEIVNKCQWIGRDYYHIDHGYLRRGHYNGYYRVTKNALQADLSLDCLHQRDSGRFRSLDIPLRPWRRTGRHILVCPITNYFGNFLNIPVKKWTETVVGELSRHTDRPILVKEKGEGDLRSALEDAWCVVCYASNAAIEAVISGVPAIVLGDSAADPVSWSFNNIESPDWPEREDWANALAWHQFTLDEMRSGFCWERVR